MTNPLVYKLYSAPTFKTDAGTTIDPYVAAESFIRNLTVVGGGELIETEEQVEDQVYYKRTIKNLLKVGRTDFQLLQAEIYNCTKYWVKIYKICDGVETFIYRCYFNMNNVSFDLDRCEADIDLQYSSLYDCITDNRDNTQELYMINDIIPFQVNFPLGDTYTSADLRKVIEYLIQKMNCTGYENDQISNLTFPISDFFNWQIDQFGYPVNGGRTISLIETWVNPGVPMTPIPNYVNPSDTPYNIAIALKSNIIDPAASNPGVTFTLSFSQIEKILRDVFNVYWCLVPNETLQDWTNAGLQVSYWLRFEHFSWFTKSVNYDAIDVTNFPLNRFKNKFTIDSDDFPYSEEWTLLDQYGADFVGLPIIYGTCVGENKKLKRENLNVGTDFEKIVAVPAYPYSSDGFFLVDIDIPSAGSGPTGLTVKSATGALTATGPLLNGRLSIANLHRDLHKWNRPATSGDMNGVSPTAFLSPVYKRIQPDIKVENCCDDPFDPIYSLVHTEMGDGIIVEKENNYSKGRITFKLKQE